MVPGPARPRETTGTGCLALRAGRHGDSGNGGSGDGESCREPRGEERGLGGGRGKARGAGQTRGGGQARGCHQERGGGQACGGYSWRGVEARAGSQANSAPAAVRPQVAVETELKQGKIVAILFWNPKGAVDAEVSKELAAAARTQGGKLAVHQTGSGEVGAFGLDHPGCTGRSDIDDPDHREGLAARR